MESEACSGSPGGGSQTMSKKRKLSDLPDVLSCASISNSSSANSGSSIENANTRTSMAIHTSNHNHSQNHNHNHNLNHNHHTAVNSVPTAALPTGATLGPAAGVVIGSGSSADTGCCDSGSSTGTTSSILPLQATNVTTNVNVGVKQEEAVLVTATPNTASVDANSHANTKTNTHPGANIHPGANNTNVNQQQQQQQQHINNTSNIEITNTNTNTIKMELKKPPSPPPLKSTTMSHLRIKYMSQLEYMHREFKKLERQLLGARTRNGQETTGSRERREKLHSFILHLEDTMKQIELGCTLENEGKSTLSVAFSSMGGTTGTSSQGNENNSGAGGSGGKDASNTNNNNSNGESANQTLQGVRSQLNEEEEEAKVEFARSSALTKLTKEKEEEEHVQRLEEHILANLLPVKDRLTRQLAAQQGAARNPVGMPTNRRGLAPSTADRGKGTFAIGAEHRRMVQMQQQQQHERHGQESVHRPLNPDSAGPIGIGGPSINSQFGKPLGGGSSLTQKLHGRTLGSHQRANGHGVGIGGDTLAPEKTIGQTPERKLFVAGMTPGSRQVKSGVSAAAGVHDINIQNPRLKDLKKINPLIEKAHIPTPPPPPPPVAINKVGPITQNPNVQATIANYEVGNKQHQEQQEQPKHSIQKKPTISHNSHRQRVQGNVRKAVGTPQNVGSSVVHQHHVTMPSRTLKPTVPPPPPGHEMTVMQKPRKSLKDPTLTEEEKQEIRERRKFKNMMKKRRAEDRQRQLILQQQQQRQRQQQEQASVNVVRVGKMSGNARCITQRKGPRTVEYVCGLCNETYKSTCDYNPWWALTSHACVKCGKVQVPRLDISAPDNAIEYHPALLAHAADDSNKASKNTAAPSLARINIKGYMSAHTSYKDSINGTNAVGSDESLYTSDSDDSVCDDMSPAAQAENEDFGSDYSGPKFNEYDASRLLIMMDHASTCPGRHKDPEARSICTGIKFMMLHVRDCPGTTSTYDICPYPWCRKTKHLLYHLVSCLNPDECMICSPDYLSPQLKQLKGLNTFRRKKQKERGKELPIDNSASSKTSNKLNNTNQTNTQVNRGIVNPHRKPVFKGTIQQAKRSHVQNPSLSVQKVSHINKRKPLSVPSPIATLGTGVQETVLSKPSVSLLVPKKHPGAPSVIMSKTIAQSNVPRQPIRGHLNIAAPANPLLATPKESAPRSQPPTVAKEIPVSRPPLPANPLLQQIKVDSYPSNNMSVKKTVMSIQRPNNGTILNSTTINPHNQTHKHPGSVTGFNEMQPKSEHHDKTLQLHVDNTSAISQNHTVSLSTDTSTKVVPSGIIMKQEDNETSSYVAPVESNNITVGVGTMQKTKSETMLEVGC